MKRTRQKRTPWRRVVLLLLLTLATTLLTVHFVQGLFSFSIPYQEIMVQPKLNRPQKVNKIEFIKKEIARIEGYGVKGSLAQRQNNPGNLKFVGQKNAVLGAKGFAKFKTPQDGFNALHNQIVLDAKRGHTLETFLYKYAPPKENNTLKYIAFISATTGIPSKSKLINHI